MKKLNVIITSGGTSEPIDTVRKITNMATGRLGRMICDQFLDSNSINKIYYICPQNADRPIRDERLIIVSSESVADLEKNITEIMSKEKIDCFIHAMAVSDYTVDYVSSAKLLSKEIVEKIDVLYNDINIDAIKEYGNIKDRVQSIIEDTIKNSKETMTNNSKISSNEDNLLIKLKQTPKIISLIKKMQPEIFLVGFKLLNNVSTGHLIDIAYQQMKKNYCDLVVANDLINVKDGLHIAHIVKLDKSYSTYTTKEDIARNLVSIITENI